MYLALQSLFYIVLKIGKYVTLLAYLAKRDKKYSRAY